MKIDVDKSAIDYINENGGVVYVDLYTAGSCCVQVTEPVIKFGKPVEMEQYNEFTVYGIKVYVSKFIHLKDELLTIKLKNFMGIKNLSLTGIRML